MKIIKTSWFPFRGYSTINIFGILFTKSSYLTEDTILHERIHTAQMKEMLYIFFYIWYGLEYIIIRFFHKTQYGAYKDVSFEEEAHNNDYNKNYLETRRHYAWIKYLKISNRK